MHAMRARARKTWITRACKGLNTRAAGDWYNHRYKRPIESKKCDS